MGRVSDSRYCAFCKSPRVVYTKRHVSLLDVFLAILCGFLLSLIFWQKLDPRLVVFIALGLGAAEIFVVIRWRLSIACPHCGFDPVLYRKKAELAVQRVKEHYARRLEDPAVIFSPPPKLTPIIKKASERPSPPAIP